MNFRSVVEETTRSTSIESTIVPTNVEITEAPPVDLDLNIQIQVASGSCNLYTRRDLLPDFPLTMSMSKSSAQPQTKIGPIKTINKVDYQLLPISLPALEVDIHYNSQQQKKENRRANFYCRAMIQSPSSQIVLHPIIMDFLAQTFEHVQMSSESSRHETEQNEDSNQTNSDHLDTM